MKKELLAYTAGLIDADGYISIIPRSGKYRKGYTPVVKLAAVDNITIDFLLKNFNGYTHIRSFESNAKDATCWELKNKKPVSEFLIKIRKYLRLKKGRADLVIEYCETPFKQVHPWSKDYDPEVVERRHAIYKSLKNLNHRGKATRRD